MKPTTILLTLLPITLAAPVAHIKLKTREEGAKAPGDGYDGYDGAYEIPDGQIQSFDVGVDGYGYVDDGFQVDVDEPVAVPVAVPVQPDSGVGQSDANYVTYVNYPGGGGVGGGGVVNSGGGGGGFVGAAAVDGPGPYIGGYGGGYYGGFYPGYYPGYFGVGRFGALGVGYGGYGGFGARGFYA
ncbi:hypothetical protein OQA88_8378 [Cercophora sp. LCS_1]